MKARLVPTLLVALASMAWAVPAPSQILEDAVHVIKRDFKRNNCWPEPFVRPDRVAVRVPFAAMVNSGWQQQNHLGAFHFEENGKDLNEAGKLKLRWILAEMPPHHRTVFIERADTQELTASRLASVQDMAAKLAVHDEVPNVAISYAAAPGWPADEVDAIGRKFQASTPQPRLPEMNRDTDK